MSRSTDITKDVNRGLAWVGLASSTVGALDFLAQILILAFWVSPAQYGVASLAVTLFPVLDIATDLGLTSAVIQRDDHSEEKISTVFWLSLATSAVIFCALAFGVGPLLSWLYAAPVVGAMLTVYGVKLVWQNVYFMPAALMRRELRFKELSVIRMLANIAEFAGKVGFAAAGYGIWCFVLGPMFRVLVTGIGVQIRHPWRPRAVLRVREALDWAAFGIKTSASQILFHLYTNVDYQVVGYFFGKTALGYYRMAYEIVLEPARVISEVVQQIAFPAFSRVKKFSDQLIEHFITFSRTNLVVMLAFLGVVFVSADDFIATIYGHRWMPAVPAMRILCAVGVLRAMSYVVPPLLDGMGFPQRTLLYQAVASIVLPSFFVASALLATGSGGGFVAVAIAWAAGYPIAFAVLSLMALRALGLRARVYGRRVAGIAVSAAIAMGASFVVRRLAGGFAPPMRLALAAATMLAVFAVLLARYEGISPRTIARALKG